MNEEEKEAIEYLKGKFELFEEDDTLAKWDYEAINTMLGLIDKLQKENEDMREELQMYVDTDVMILQKELKDSINARFELQRRIDKLQKENKELKEKLHEKNMQIIKLNELLAEVIDMPNEENSNQPKI